MSFYCKQVDNLKKSTDINSLLTLGEQIAQIVNDVKQSDPFKLTPYKFKLHENIDYYNADALYCISYPKEGSPYRYTDLWNSWVMGISFGASCDFRYGLNKNNSEFELRIEESEYDILNNDVIKFTKKMKKGSDIVVKIGPGDVIVFNGNLLYHSVSKIYDDCPKYISDSIEEYNVMKGKNICRMNIQYRDSRTMDDNIFDENIQKLHANNIENMRLAQAKLTLDF